MPDLLQKFRSPCNLHQAPGSQCYDFLKVSPKDSAKKWRFLTRNKAKLCKILIITVVFEKTPFFSPKIVENRRKL
jgi:hypothetical protein